MRIQDFSNVWNADDDREIERILATRYDHSNAFWLSHGEQKYPYMLLLVNGQMANLHYFPRDRHPGFRSIGKLEGLRPGAMSTFFLTKEGQGQEVLNDSIIPFPNAVIAVKEFANSPERPNSIEWFEL